MRTNMRKALVKRPPDSGPDLSYDSLTSTDNLAASGSLLAGNWQTNSRLAVH